MDNFISRLQIKYEYSNELVEFLKEAIPAIVAYYGEDKIGKIMQTLNDCEIHIQKMGENTNDYLSQYFGIEGEKMGASLAIAAKMTNLKLVNGKVLRKHLIYVKNVDKQFTFTDAHKATIIHELCHAIKEGQDIEMVDGKVTVNSGLMKEHYEYDSATNQFIIDESKSENVGLEEALNCYEEEEIMRIMTGLQYHSSMYSGISEFGRAIMRNPDVKKAIKRSQFNGDETWKNFVEEETANFLINNADDYVKSFYVSITEFRNNRDAFRKKKRTAMNNINNYIESQKQVEDKKDTFIYNLRGMVNEHINSSETSAPQEKIEKTR